MRLIVIGSPQQRQELAEQIDSAVPDIVGEFGSLAQARESGTPREIEVLELVSEGLSNKAVAARLGISDQTVKFHLATISGKLGAVNRTDAVRRAVRRGLITL